MEIYRRLTGIERYSYDTSAEKVYKLIKDFTQ